MSKTGSTARLKVVLLTTDNRWIFNDYGNPKPYFGPAPSALLQGLVATPELEVHVVSCTRKPMRSPEKLAANTWFHSVPVRKIGWMRTVYLGCIWKTRKKIREIQPDIVHGQGTEMECGLGAVFSGFPSVLTIHGNMRRIARVERRKPFSHPWLAARLEAFTIPRSLGVVCVSSHTQREVADLAKRTWVVPNAVDPALFEVVPQPKPNAPPRILCVGRVGELKNQNAFIRALDALATVRQFEVIFLGKVNADTPYGGEFLRLVAERPWCSQVGFVSRDDLKTHLGRASVLALTSLEDNCPMVVLEAMAAGVPVVASNVGGVPDLIEEGRTGWFCDPHDSVSMRGGVEKVLANQSAAEEMAKFARQRALGRFHPKAVAQRHLEIYREVLASYAAKAGRG